MSWYQAYENFMAESKPTFCVMVGVAMYVSFLAFVIWAMDGRPSLTRYLEHGLKDPYSRVFSVNLNMLTSGCFQWLIASCNLPITSKIFLAFASNFVSAPATWCIFFFLVPSPTIAYFHPVASYMHIGIWFSSYFLKKDKLKLWVIALTMIETNLFLLFTSFSPYNGDPSIELFVKIVHLLTGIVTALTIFEAFARLWKTSKSKEDYELPIQTQKICLAQVFAYFLMVVALRLTVSETSSILPFVTSVYASRYLVTQIVKTEVFLPLQVPLGFMAFICGFILYLQRKERQRMARRNKWK